MNFLSLFVLIPLLMTCAMFLTKDIRRIRAIMVVGASLLLGLSVALVAMYLGERSAGNGAEMLFTADAVWYAPLNIHYSVGVDGISVAMLLLSSVIVFTGVFASWKMSPLPREFSHGSRCCRSGCLDSSFRLICSRCSCFTRWR